MDFKGLSESKAILKLLNIHFVCILKIFNLHCLCEIVLRDDLG